MKLFLDKRKNLFFSLSFVVAQWGEEEGGNRKEEEELTERFETEIMNNKNGIRDSCEIS